METSILELRPAGYIYLIDTMELICIPHWHKSFISTSDTYSSNTQDGVTEDIYPARYWPGDDICDHLEFALKYDGVNLGVLVAIFGKISQDKLTLYIKSNHIKEYARRVWFFYEFLMGIKLPIEDITSGMYVEALDAEYYYTIKNGAKYSRYRVIDNLLGSKEFCPIVRKTQKLSMFDLSDLQEKCDEILSSYPSELFDQALRSLYNKEAKSSFKIEHINASTSQTEEFILLLKQAEEEDFCEKERLIELQNRIVESRFKDSDYRKNQNYVGQTVAFEKEIVHFICPKPDDLPKLMRGLIDSHKRMKTGDVSPVIHAAIIAYGFVFLHPFEDGNGRIHRFLIHNILSLQEVVPRGLMFPISAVVLKNPGHYDTSLEAFSKPLLRLTHYRLDERGQMTVEDDSACWYRYIDMTPQSEALYNFVSKTIKEEIVEELRQLVNYEDTRRAIEEIVGMPDHLIDLFIRLCRQNKGYLSARKRSTYFSSLSDEELQAMEQAVKKGYDRLD